MSRVQVMNRMQTKNRIERNVAKVICGEETGNAVFLDSRRVLTLKHCISQYFEEGEPIYLEYYAKGSYVRQ